MKSNRLGVTALSKLVLLAGTLALCVLPGGNALSQPAPTKGNARAARQTAGGTYPASPSDEGDRVFRQQCSRCHNAPEGFSPRISGTIVRHMRVRASLTAQEEEALLRFLNPQ